VSPIKSLGPETISRECDLPALKLSVLNDGKGDLRTTERAEVMFNPREDSLAVRHLLFERKKRLLVARGESFSREQKTFNL
jgi:hypothetical protein